MKSAQLSYAFRHMEALGFNRATVPLAIEKHFFLISSTFSDDQLFN